ncbi:unnamed protein product [Cuscuta europaea]|uniref:Uncharacterized protein n=1 Tax=Cuscuta europaea TaxID=41803 RepID=A0A9P1E1J2_CUSEU|nr:unnamed protein product [Cuscuta europaea]
MKRNHDIFLPPPTTVYGPFSEDPTEAPPEKQINRIGDFLSIGLLKEDDNRKYKMDEERMHGIPMLLDTIKIESKTWLYNLYFKDQWMQDTHMVWECTIWQSKEFITNSNKNIAQMGRFLLQC